MQKPYALQKAQQKFKKSNIEMQTCACSRIGMLTASPLFRIQIESWDLLI